MVCKSAAIATADLSCAVRVEVNYSTLGMVYDFTDAVFDLLMIRH